LSQSGAPDINASRLGQRDFQIHRTTTVPSSATTQMPRRSTSTSKHNSQTASQSVSLVLNGKSRAGSSSKQAIVVDDATLMDSQTVHRNPITKPNTLAKLPSTRVPSHPPTEKTSRVLLTQPTPSFTITSKNISGLSRNKGLTIGNSSNANSRPILQPLRTPQQK